MSEKSDRIDQLEEANERLHAGLRQCHALVADLREKLAANVNDPPLLAERDTGWPEAASD
jgi:hypothetical protein